MMETRERVVGAINVVAVPGVVVVVVVVGIRHRCGVCTSKSNCKKTVSEAKKNANNLTSASRALPSPLRCRCPRCCQW